jgi:hypothetical protein
MSKTLKPVDLTLSATSSVGDMFISSVDYVKKQSTSLSWEQIIIICLTILLIISVSNNRSKNRIINRQNSELKRSRSRSTSRRFIPEYDE